MSQIWGLCAQGIQAPQHKGTCYNKQASQRGILGHHLGGSLLSDRPSVPSGHGVGLVTEHILKSGSFGALLKCCLGEMVSQ